MLTPRQFSSTPIEDRAVSGCADLAANVKRQQAPLPRCRCTPSCFVSARWLQSSANNPQSSLQQQPSATHHQTAPQRALSPTLACDPQLHALGLNPMPNQTWCESARGRWSQPLERSKSQLDPKRMLELRRHLRSPRCGCGAKEGEGEEETHEQREARAFVGHRPKLARFSLLLHPRHLTGSASAGILVGEYAHEVAARALERAVLAADQGGEGFSRLKSALLRKAQSPELMQAGIGVVL